MSQVFSFESHKVRTITQNGQPWFAGRDIALLLGYAQPEKEVRRVCKHVELLKSTNLVEFKISPAGLLIIPESDVWRLIIRSTLPKAQEVEEWIMGEVLPAIRKTGRYEAPQQLALPAKPKALPPAHPFPNAEEWETELLSLHEDFLRQSGKFEVWLGEIERRLRNVTSPMFTALTEDIARGTPLVSKERGRCVLHIGSRGALEHVKANLREISTEIWYTAWFATAMKLRRAE